jgi:hypothetical protein
MDIMSNLKILDTLANGNYKDLSPENATKVSEMKNFYVDQVYTQLKTAAAAKPAAVPSPAVPGSPAASAAAALATEAPAEKLVVVPPGENFVGHGGGV